MKKKLNIEGITNELKGSSAFFPSYKKKDTPLPPEPVQQVKEIITPPSPAPEKPKQKLENNNSDSNIASKQASMIADNQESIETIRKSVKRVGKEVSFVRLTPEEKKQLGDLVHEYKNKGIKTSENEIGRIGINHLLKDYQDNGEESILAKVLAALND